MIADLDKTLRELLNRELLKIPLDFTITPDQISFATPDATFAPTGQFTVNLFLYDIRENRELRSNDWSVERNNKGKAIKKRPAVRVDCSYLITTWAQDPESEHYWLGQVLQILLTYPTLPSEVLQGCLKGQQPALPTSTLQASHLQSLAEFWQALGGKPRAALHYTVTCGLEIGVPEAVPLVTETMLEMRLERRTAP
jgi:hypothetical protein